MVQFEKSTDTDDELQGRKHEWSSFQLVFKDSFIYTDEIVSETDVSNMMLEVLDGEQQ